MPPQVFPKVAELVRVAPPTYTHTHKYKNNVRYRLRDAQLLLDDAGQGPKCLEARPERQSRFEAETRLSKGAWDEWKPPGGASHEGVATEGRERSRPCS